MVGKCPPIGAHPPPYGGGIVFSPPILKSRRGGIWVFPPPTFKTAGGGIGRFPTKPWGEKNFGPLTSWGGTTFLVSPPIGWRGKLKLSQKRRELSRKTRFWADFGQSMGGDNFFMGGDNFRPPPRFDIVGGERFVPPHGSDTLGGEFFWCPPPPWGGMDTYG